MSDPYYGDEEEAAPHPADPPQQLVDFVGVFTDPQAQDVFRDAAVQVQNYVVQKSIADDNQAAADRLVSNLGAFKDGLAAMASDDPAATFLGIDLVPGVVDGIVNTHPFLPDEQRQDVYDQLTSDMQRDIARSGVMALADRSDTAARALLDHPKVAGLFDDRDRAGLNGYIGAQATARDMDASALSQQRAQDAERMRAVSAVSYFGALIDPNTQELQFPAGWAQKVTADTTLPPGDTASMLNLYGRLQANGDAPLSDPSIVADLLNAAANGTPVAVSGVLNKAGDQLRLVDALTLAAMSGPQSPEMMAGTKALAATVQAFRNQVVTPENGPAGAAAFERFVNWIVPEFRGGGSLDPKSENYIMPTEGTNHSIFWSAFAPRMDDLVLGDSTPGITLDAKAWAQGEDRMSLDQIFGAPRRGVVGDEVIRPPRPADLDRMPNRPAPPMMGSVPAGSPTFFDENNNPLPGGGLRYDNPEIKS